MPNILPTTSFIFIQNQIKIKMSLILNKQQNCYFYKINRNISDELFYKLKFSPQCISYKEDLCKRSGLSEDEIQDLEKQGVITFSNIKWEDIPNSMRICWYFGGAQLLDGSPYNDKIFTI